MPTALQDLLEAKREMSLKYLAPMSEVPQFAALTMSSIAGLAAPLVNVHAVGLGWKVVEGRDDRVKAVRFYVNRKLPKWMLSGDDRLPTDIDGIPTDVIESVPAAFAAEPFPQRLHMRPVLGGASIAHGAVGAGTLAAICRREPDDGVRFALSNNHVFSNLGRAAIGDAILQPSPLDLAQDERAGSVARLASFEPIRTDGTRNHVDAALAEFLPGMASATTNIVGIGSPGSPGEASEGMQVIKSGRTTGVTRGVVMDMAYDVQLPLQGLGLAGSAIFEDVLRVEGQGAVVGNPGDSGSLFLSDDAALAPVGLLFATGAGGGYALACKLGAVLTRMGVVIA